MKSKNTGAPVGMHKHMHWLMLSAKAICWLLRIATAVGTGRKGALTDTASQQIGRVQGRHRVIGSDRFVKKNIGGSPTGKRVEAPQALTCNTNTGVRIDPPPQKLKSTETRGSKNHWEG